MQSISRIPGPEDGVKNELKLKCYACEATFGNEEALRNHKIQMREEEYRNELYLTHIYCHYCDQDFMTERAGKSHWDQVSIQYAPCHDRLTSELILTCQ